MSKQGEDLPVRIGRRGSLRIPLAATSFVGNEYGEYFPNANGRRDIPRKANLGRRPGFFLSRRIKRTLVQRSVEPQISFVVSEISV